MIDVPIEFLVHSFSYEEYLDDDDYQKPIYAKPVEVSLCRIDNNVVYSRDKTQAQIVADAVIFCYADSTVNFRAFKEQSKVTFGGSNKIIKKVVEISDVATSRVWAYELEVL